MDDSENIAMHIGRRAPPEERITLIDGPAEIESLPPGETFLVPTVLPAHRRQGSRPTVTMQQPAAGSAK